MCLVALVLMAVVAHKQSLALAREGSVASGAYGVMHGEGSLPWQPNLPEAATPGGEHHRGVGWDRDGGRGGTPGALVVRGGSLGSPAKRLGTAVPSRALGPGTGMGGALQRGTPSPHGMVPPPSPRPLRLRSGAKESIAEGADALLTPDILKGLKFPSGDGWSEVDSLVLHAEMITSPAAHSAGMDKFFTKSMQKQLLENKCLPARDYSRRFRTCAVVGNGGVLLSDKRNGEGIDAHDAVFRFNDGPTEK